MSGEKCGDAHALRTFWRFQEGRGRGKEIRSRRASSNLKLLLPLSLISMNALYRFPAAHGFALLGHGHAFGAVACNGQGRIRSCWSVVPGRFLSSKKSNTRGSRNASPRMMASEGKSAWCTPAEETSAEIKVKNSRFIGTIAYTPSVEDAR